MAAEAEQVEQPEADGLLPIRRLHPSDRSKGFVELLSQLSPCGPISDEEFLARFSELAAYGDDHVIVVVEDEGTGRIVATGSVFVERKFLRGCGKVGHIEDVVVDAAARGKRVGQRVVRHLVEHAQEAGCYKVILDCTAELRSFYEKCGFKEKNVQMGVYFQERSRSWPSPSQCSFFLPRSGDRRSRGGRRNSLPLLRRPARLPPSSSATGAAPSLFFGNRRRS